MIGVLRHRTFWKYILLPHLAFGLLAILTADKTMVGVATCAMLSISVNVSVAYAPNAFDMMTTDNPTDSQIVGLGIFLAWFSVALGAVISLMVRYVHGMGWLLDSDWLSYRLWQGCEAAILHLIVPNVIEGVIPPRKWVRVGAVAGAGCFVGLLIILLTDDRFHGLFDFF